MKFKYELRDTAYFSAAQLTKIFPVNFVIEQDDKIYLLAEFPPVTTESDSLYIVQREIDRIFFLTGVNMKYELKTIEDDNGINIGLNNLRMDLGVVELLPNDIDHQQWSKDNITVHLRLWNMAHSLAIPLAAKINLLFQIIEIEYPNTQDKEVYIPYLDTKNPPSNMTEAKLLRDLMSHGKNSKVKTQLENYCKFLKLKPGMHDPADRDFMNCVKKRLFVLENEAQKIIESKITKTH